MRYRGNGGQLALLHVRLNHDMTEQDQLIPII